MKKDRLIIGILAHVDAGKTTLAEGLLYTCGSLRTLGRVDHRDAFLDNFSMERERGITIFSKQAQISWQELDITLLDTPGHVDFSAEMERALQVLDYAILVVNGAEGVQGHTRTLWRLLERYEIPVFLFVNKMDQEGTDEEKLLRQLQKDLDENCVCFGSTVESNFMENLSLCSEALMEEYLETGALSEESIAGAVADRSCFPCYFGSALKLQGVEALLWGLRRFALIPEYPEDFGARVFKISRDEAGNRLTHLKVTGGSLRVKQLVNQEKADQLRVYHGAKFQTVEEADAGSICAVTGLHKTYAGQGLGAERESGLPVLEPVLVYRLLLPEGEDAVSAMGKLRRLEEEEPLLHIVWKEESKEIHVQVMGDVQIEVLRSLLRERYGMEVSFGAGSIVYKETIAEAVEGIGHFEPLRHYAEVHLLLEPGERGSGLQFASVCSEDILDKNWQRLILTHLEEKIHPGVLTGSEITDMRIVLVSGRAHDKHTEGGDFRQATYRAVRNGLKKAACVLLEPVYAFRMELPGECVGRAMSDIQRMYGSCVLTETGEESAVLSGRVPAASMGDYQRELTAYTKGMGRLSCTLDGYEPCHNAEEVIAATGYESESDLENPTGSVFCAHGAGFAVPWYQVEEYAHVESFWKTIGKTGGEDVARSNAGEEECRNASGERHITQEEIEEIFQRTYGKKQEDHKRFRRYRKRQPTVSGGAAGGGRSAAEKPKKGEYLLVDGYNIIFAWQELRELSERNIDSARDKLMDIMSNYQGYLGYPLILVFDAYKVKGSQGTVSKYHNIHVVYTREAETADQYIERTVHDMGKDYRVTVATSDRLEQMIIWGSGAMRMSAGELLEAVEAAERDMRESYLEKQERLGNKPHF